MPHSKKSKRPQASATPGLTSASSISSSSGPITPPQTSHGFQGPSPFPISSDPNFPTKLPPNVVPPRAHPLLESAVFIWDLIEKPTTIDVSNYTISRRLLLEQATNPPLPALSITSSLLPSRWTIHVPASNGSYVTLKDLFDAIYHSLRMNIVTNEFISLHQTDQTRATRAYKQRYRRFRDITAHDQEQRGGMKRVDFLMGHTRFHSISKTGRRPDEWQLNVS